MTISIPEDILREAGLTERDALIEFACRLFDAERLSKSGASRMCGLNRPEFEAELRRRKLAVYRTTLAEYEQDTANFRRES